MISSLHIMITLLQPKTNVEGCVIFYLNLSEDYFGARDVAWGASPG